MLSENLRWTELLFDARVYWVALGIVFLCFISGMQCGDLHWRKVSFTFYLIGSLASLLALINTYLWPYFVRDQLEVLAAVLLLVLMLVCAFYALERIRSGEDW
jgi:hypothetical protein